MRTINPNNADCKPNCELAYTAYQTLRQAETCDPALKDNPYWQALVDSAYARFFAAWEAV